MPVLLIIFLSASSFAASQKGFEFWKKTYIARAAKVGISKSLSKAHLKGMKFDQKVLDRSRNQILMDRTKDYPSLIKKWLRQDEERISEGIMQLKKHRVLLEKVERRYGVDKEIIVALWGIETLYGRITGDYDVVRSLATLAYSSHRKKFYEVQLNAIFRIMSKGHVKREDLKGSWAGATGQCQFMPSNFKGYAQDFDGDGRKDIWSNYGDIFASIAFLLKKAGWKKGASVGTLAIAPRKHALKPNKFYSLTLYRNRGFKSLNGKPLAGKRKKRKYSEIPLENSPVVLRGRNYAPLMVWNRSSLFAAFNILLLNGFKQAGAI